LLIPAQPRPAERPWRAMSRVSFSESKREESRREESKGAKLTSNASLTRRLNRQNSYASLVVEASSEANEVLQEFAACVKPEWDRWRAMRYGCFIDFLKLVHAEHWLPLDDFTRCIISAGGAEQMRFLLALAQFDKDGDGTISADEMVQYEKAADTIISDSVTLCSNLALVGTLLLGLTHLVVIGRPEPLVVSAASAEAFGPALSLWLLDLAYTFSAVCECCAFFVLCCAIITRNCLTNILPTRELKIDMLRTTNALGMQGVGTVITLWSFLLANAFSVLIASPTTGPIGLVLFTALLGAVAAFVAPIRFLSVILLHEEVTRSLRNHGGSFVSGKKASALSSMAV